MGAILSCFAVGWAMDRPNCHADKTGYPSDMLDLELDLEADLGIDTVKQAEVFASIRETFDIPRDDTVKLRDYPTLTSVIGFVRDRANLLAPAAPVGRGPSRARPPPRVPAQAAHRPRPRRATRRREGAQRRRRQDRLPA